MSTEDDPDETRERSSTSNNRSTYWCRGHNCGGRHWPVSESLDHRAAQRHAPSPRKSDEPNLRNFAIILSSTTNQFCTNSADPRTNQRKVSWLRSRY